MTRTLRTLLAITVLLAAGCESREAALDDAVPDSGGPGADAAHQDVSAEHDSSGGEEAAADETSTPCTPESLCATGATFCCPWRGDVYLWPAKGCREKLHSLTDGIYECLDTGIAAIEQGACKGYTVVTCYERDRGDEEKLVILSSVQWPSEYLASSSWHPCSADVQEAIAGVPDC